MIQDDHGQSDESLSSFERSIDLLDQLNRDQPGDAAHAAPTWPSPITIWPRCS